MITLLFAIQCLGRDFDSAEALCRSAKRTSRLEARYYENSLLCRGKRYAKNFAGHDNTLLMGRVVELEEENRALRKRLNSKPLPVVCAK